MADGFVYGGNTGITYAELQRRRAIAAALAARQRKAPSNLGEGLTYFAENIREGLDEARLGAAEKAQAERDREALAGPSLASPPPAVSGVTPPPAVPAQQAVPPPPPSPIAAPPTLDPNVAFNPAAGALPPGGIGTPPGQPVGAVPAMPAVPAVAPATAPRAEDSPLNDPVWQKRSAALGGIESGGARDPYRLKVDTQRGDFVYGKYQIKGSNIPAWTREALGRTMTPEEFLADPDAQERTARHQFSKYADQYGEEGAARAWFAGPKGMENLGATDRFKRLTVAGYGQDYLRRLGGPPGPAGAPPGSRDAIAATLAQTRQGPPTAQEAASEDLLQEVVGGRGGGGPLFPPTASAGRAGVVGDAPVPGASPLTGAVTDPGIGDTLQNRRNAIARTIQTAQARTVPVTAADMPTGAIAGSVAPPSGIVLPNVRPAPPIDGAIPKAPEPVPFADPGPEPRPPGPTDEMKRWRAGANNVGGISPDVRARLQSMYDEAQKIQQADFTRQWVAWNKKATDKAEYDRADPQRRQELEQRHLANIKLRNELNSEGATPLTAQEREAYGVPANLPAFKNWRGEIKFGPAGTNVTVDTGQKQEGEEAKVRGKLAAEREGELLQSASRAGAGLVTVNRAEALLDQINTGRIEPTKLSIGAFARSVGVPDETLARLGLKPEQIGSKQAFNAIANELVIGKLGAGGFPTQNFSNTDRDFLVNTAPTLGDDDASNRIKLGAARLVHQRDLEKADEWSKYRRNPENKGKSFVDFEFDWNDKVSKTNLTGELRKQADELITRAREGRAPAPAPETPADVSEGTIQRNSAGELRVRRGGKWEMIPNAP